MELSLLANFDDLRRCDDILTDGTAEIGKQRTAFFIPAYALRGIAISLSSNLLVN